MKRFAILIAVGMAVVAMPEIGVAQTPPNQPATGMQPDRTTAPKADRRAMMERRAALKKQRAECRAKARAEKVPVRKRLAYIKDCMSRSPAQ